MLFKDYLLTEKIINIFDNNEKRKYAQDVFNLVQKSYEKVGGIKGSGFNSAEDMIENIQMWKLVIKNNKILCGLLYKDKSGRKLVAIFQNLTDEGKYELSRLLKNELFDREGTYFELSDSVVAFIKRNTNNIDIDEKIIPVEYVKKILKDDKIIPINKFEYKRNIGGELHRKTMFGDLDYFKAYGTFKPIV